MSSRRLMMGVGLVLVGGGALVLARWKTEDAAPVAPAVARREASREPTATRGAESEGLLGVILPEGSVDVVSRLEGRLASLKVQVGQAVKQGQVLASLDVEPLRKDLAVAQAEAGSALADQEISALALSEAEERLARRDDPNQLRVGALSEEELNTARYEQRLALAKLEAAKARVVERQARVARLQQDIDDAQLRAPFDGVVAGRVLDVGAHVRAGQVLLHLLRAGAPRVRFAVPEGQWREVATGQRVRVVLPEERLTVFGSIVTVAPEVDAVARVVLALAEFDAPPSGSPLPSGAVVRVFVEPDSRALRGAP